ncbi:MAG: hypothetical protein KAU62_16925 [Candidatus Heimdallarchaeota archaeon]|nr:hypothetical protein [Candidatus Heimdallarchaeota archaeon]MCK4612842.1 hypothetical protein [Candidatus Heimdallarchaeota archaeon]
MSEKTFLEIGQDSLSETDLEVDIGDFKEVKLKRKTKREWRGDVTAAFFNRLVPPVEEGKVKVRDLLIDGSREMGKSTKACGIAKIACLEIIQERGYSYNLITVRSFKQVTQFFTTDPYQVVMIDDALRYSRKLSKEVADTFEEIRHAYEKIAATGVIIVLWMVQEAYRIDREVREQMTAGIMICNLKLSNWFIDDLSRFVGPNLADKILNMLGGWIEDKLDGHNDAILVNAIIITHTWIGKVVIQMPEEPEWLPYKEFTNEQGIRFLEPEKESVPLALKHLSGDFTFKLKEEFSDIPLILEALSNWETIKKERRITTKKLKQKHIEVFMLKLKGWTVNSIAAKYSVSDSAISNDYDNNGWEAIVRREIIGYLLEWCMVQEGGYYENYKMIAGTGKVDLLSPGKDLAVEIKCRNRLTTPNHKMFSKEMLEMLETGSTECELCVCVVNKNIGLFRIYSIINNPQTTNPDKKTDLTTPPPEEKSPQKRLNGGL